METINADDILYIKPRDGKLQESQLKASFDIMVDTAHLVFL